jgi:hypothetical protein
MATSVWSFGPSSHATIIKSIEGALVRTYVRHPEHYRQVEAVFKSAFANRENSIDFDDRVFDESECLWLHELFRHAFKGGGYLTPPLARFGMFAAINENPDTLAIERRMHQGDEFGGPKGFWYFGNQAQLINESNRESQRVEFDSNEPEDPHNR